MTTNYRRCENPECNYVFKPSRTDQKFCCKGCKQAAYRSRQPKQSEAKEGFWNNRYEHAYETRRSNLIQITCPICGSTRTIDGNETNRMYCSDACKQKAYRARKVK